MMGAKNDTVGVLRLGGAKDLLLQDQPWEKTLLWTTAMISEN